MSKGGGHVLEEYRQVLRDHCLRLLCLGEKNASAAELLTAPLPHVWAVTLLWPQRRRWR